MQRKDWGAHTSQKAKNSLCLLTVNLNVKSGEAWSFCHLQNSSFLNIFTLQQTSTSEQSFLNMNYTMQWNNCKLPHSSQHPLWCLLMKETTDAELIEIKISPCPFEGNRRQAIWGETRLRLSAGLPAFNFYSNPLNNIICGVFLFPKGFVIRYQKTELQLPDTTELQPQSLNETCRSFLSVTSF